MLLLFYSLLVPKRMLIYENLYNITKLIKVGNKRTSLVIQGLRLCASCHSPQWLHQFTFPPTVLEGSLFFTSSPAFSVCGFFDDGHSDRFEQIPHYSFNLHFSNNERCWASFHVGVGHLKINSKKKRKASVLSGRGCLLDSWSGNQDLVAYSSVWTKSKTIGNQKNLKVMWKVGK